MKTNTWIALGAFIFVASFAAATSFNSPSQKAATLSSTAADQALVNANKVGPGTGTVVPLPEKIFLAGGNSTSSNVQNDVWQSNDVINWTNISPNNNNATTKWSTRYGHTMTYFNGKLWVIGGIHFPCSQPCGLNDVWSSPDGINWTQVTQHAPFGGRQDHEVLVFNNKLYVMGGNDTTNNDYNDVWSSPDGINWTQVVQHAGWAPRSDYAAVVYQNKIWVMGGTLNNGTPPLNDIWSSPDGLTWTQVTPATTWPARYGHSSVVYQNKMWVIGSSGVPSQDVWSSPDGINWTQTANNLTGFVTWHDSAVFAGKMWVTSGVANGMIVSSVWSSTDGISWTLENPGAPWIPRVGHTLAVTPVSFGLTDLQPITLTWNGIGNMSPYHNKPLSTSLASNGYVYFSAEIKNTSTTLPVTVPTNTRFEIKIVNNATGFLYTTAITTVGTPFIIAPNGTKTLTFTTPQNPNMLKVPGTYTTTLNVDANNLVSESNETNNTLTKTLIIQ